MSRLKTLPATEHKRLLLIGAEAWLFSLINKLFTEHDLDVVGLTTADFLNLDQTTLDLETIYKIVWWVDFTDLKTAQQTLTNLSSLTDLPLIVLGELPEVFLLEDEELPPPVVATQDFFTTLNQTLVSAQLFFVRDLLGQNQLTSPLSFAFRGWQKNMLLDPQDHWFFSSGEDFFGAIEPYLIRPHAPRHILIQGKKLISSVVLKRVADLILRYYDRPLQVISVIAERSSPPLPDFVEATLQTKSMEQVDELMRQKETWESSAQALSFPESEQWQKTQTEEFVNKADQDSSSDAGSEEQKNFMVAEERQRINEGKRLINRQKTPNNPAEEQQIEGELSRIFHHQRDEKKKKRIDSKIKIVKKISQKSKKNQGLFFGGMTTMVAGGIILLLWGALLLSTFFARREMLSFFTTYNPESKAAYQPGFWTKTLTKQVNFYQEFLPKDWLGATGELADLSKNLRELNQEQFELNRLTGQYFLSVLGRGEVSPDIDLLEEKTAAAQQTTGRLLASAGLVLSDAENLENSWLTTLQQAQQTQALKSQLPSILAQVFGSEGKRTYAVLLQNNLELRPTGGFIQAIGFFTFDQGLLIDSQFISPYNLDQRVLASVLAPAEVRKYLGEENWYLRDSNWNPDFPESALRVAWFIRQAVGLQVDGVWALNYLALEEMLSAVGPLDLSSHNELLTEKNLLERVEFHSDDELANSQGQQDYALAVFAQLLQHLQTMPAEQAVPFLEALAAGLTNKQILVSLFEQDQAEAMERLGWNGQIINPVCPTQFSQVTCLVDQVFQVEANISLNRVGAYLRREVEHRVDLTGEKVAHTRVLRLENTSRSDGWPLGSYRAYLRFILDGEAQPSSVTVDGRRLAGDQLMVYGEGGRRVVGVPVEVPKQTTVTIEFSYLTEAVPQASFSYLLFDQQQSGIKETPTKITVYHPDKKATVVAPTADFYGNSVEFNQVKDNHLFVGVRY